MKSIMETSLKRIVHLLLLAALSILTVNAKVSKMCIRDRTKALQGTAKGATNLVDKNNYTNWVWDNMVRYSWEHKIHKIDFTGVYSLQQNQDEKMRGASKDLPFNSLSLLDG